MDEIDIYQEVDLQDCPICGGPALLQEEQCGCFSVACLDCGSYSGEVYCKDAGSRLEAAQQAAYIWNIGKIINSNPND